MSDEFPNPTVKLKEREVEILSQQSVKLNYAIFKLYQDDNYWKKRIEYVLGKSFGDLNVNWYNVYNKIYDRENDENLTIEKLVNLLNESIRNKDNDTVNILKLAGIGPISPISPSVGTSVQYRLTFPTGHQDVDLLILFNIDDLNRIVFFYNESGIIKRMLDNPRVFQQVKERYHLYSGYINSMAELAKLKVELEKIGPRKRMHYKIEVDDFKQGDRVVFGFDGNESNCVVDIAKTEKRDKIIEFHKVDLFGNDVNTAVIIAKLRKKHIGEWKWEGVSGWTERVSFGIVLYTNGPKINNINSVFLKYKTLPNDQQRNAAPEVNMIVSVGRRDPAFAYNITYVIESIDKVIRPDSTILSLVSVLGTVLDVYKFC